MIEKDHPLFAQFLRGTILRLVYGNHHGQQARLEAVVVANALRRMTWEVDLDFVLTQLQYLREKGYLRYQDKWDETLVRPHIYEIEITPSGHDLVERVRKDEGVKF